jgi:F-type H+-transporting ATPase subunit b
MELVKPSIGLIFWMIVSFSIILFLLKKFAWKPILGMIKEREESIENALASAEKAKEYYTKASSLAKGCSMGASAGGLTAQ